MKVNSLVKALECEGPRNSLVKALERPTMCPSKKLLMNYYAFLQHFPYGDLKVLSNIVSILLILFLIILERKKTK